MGQTMGKGLLREGWCKTCAGEFVTVTVDKAVSHKALYGSPAKLSSNVIRTVWDPARFIIISDRFVPAPDERRPNVHTKIKRWPRDSESPIFIPKVTV